MKTSLIALALAAALPFGASAAEGLSYNYADQGTATYATAYRPGSAFTSPA